MKAGALIELNENLKALNLSTMARTPPIISNYKHGSGVVKIRLAQVISFRLTFPNAYLLWLFSHKRIAFAPSIFLVANKQK